MVTRKNYSYVNKEIFSKSFDSLENLTTSFSYPL